MDTTTLPLYVIKDIFQILCQDLNKNEQIKNKNQQFENQKIILNLSLVNKEIFKIVSYNLTSCQDFNFIPCRGLYPTPQLKTRNVYISNSDKSLYKFENIENLIMDVNNYSTNNHGHEEENFIFINDYLSKCINLKSVIIDIASSKNGYYNSAMNFLEKLKFSNENVQVEIRKLNLIILESPLPNYVKSINSLLINSGSSLINLQHLRNRDIRINSLRVQGIGIDHSIWDELLNRGHREYILTVLKQIDELKVDNIDLPNLTAVLGYASQISKLTIKICYDTLMKKLGQISKQVSECNTFIELYANDVPVEWDNFIKSINLPNLKSLSITQGCNDILHDITLKKQTTKVYYDYCVKKQSTQTIDNEQIKKEFDQEFQNLQQVPFLIQLVSCFKNLKELYIKNSNLIKPLLNIAESNTTITNYKLQLFTYSFEDKKELYTEVFDSLCKNNNVIESFIINEEFYTDVEDQCDYEFRNHFTYKKL